MKNLFFFCFSYFLIQSVDVYAYTEVKFYASNNSANNLTMQGAYERLIGPEQIQLQVDFSNLLSDFVSQTYPPEFRGYI